MENLTPEEAKDLIEKVGKMYTCIVGDEEMGTKGMVERIMVLENELAKIKLLRDRILIGAGIITAGLIFLGKVGEWVLDHFSKK